MDPPRYADAERGTDLRRLAGHLHLAVEHDRRAGRDTEDLVRELRPPSLAIVRTTP